MSWPVALAVGMKWESIDKRVGIRSGLLIVYVCVYVYM